MKFLALTPMIWTSKLDETIAFYTGVLKFACRERNKEWGWATMRHGDVEMMIAVPNEHTFFEKPMYTGSFYIRTDNVEELWNELKEKTNVVYPLDNFEYGMREFAIYDNNGYMIQFGQDIEK